MALADFHYTTGISSGFKVYILEGQPSFENEHRFRRLPTHRLPVYSIKRKLCTEVRSPDQGVGGQKASKVRRAAYGPVTVSLEKKTPSAAQIHAAPAAMSCVTMLSPESCRDSRLLHPSCPQKCPLKKPLLSPPLTVSQLQQMRPSVITCAPRRSCSEAPISHPMSPLKHRNSVTDSSHSERLQAWTTSIAELGGEAFPVQKCKEADTNPSSSP